MMPFDISRTKIQHFFNAMAQPAQRQYTLGEAFNHYVRKKPFGAPGDNVLRFTKLGRMVERMHTGTGILCAGLLVCSAPLSLPVLGAATAFIGLYKGMGIAAGKLADMLAKSTAENARAIDQPRL